MQTIHRVDNSFSNCPCRKSNCAPIWDVDPTLGTTALSDFFQNDAHNVFTIADSTGVCKKFDISAIGNSSVKSVLNRLIQPLKRTSARLN